MIREWLSSVGASAASPAARRLGAVRELAALKVRHARCARAWAPHLDETRKAILAAARPHAGQNHTALVVGAGLLFDIPLAELACLFGRVYLLDVAFLRHTRRVAGRFQGAVRLILCDVTGALETVVRAGDRSDLPSLLDSVPAEAAEADWVVSVNCLTQLPLLPAQWLLQRGWPEEEVERFGRRLILNHLDSLAARGRAWCLVTEQQDTRFDRDGNVIGGTDFGPILTPWLESQAACHIADWPWTVHPQGELPNGETEIRRVFAWRSALT